MASSFEKYQKRRLISSYFSVVLSVFLVLFLLGILGLFVINSKKISNDFKEEIPMSVYFKDNANDSVLKSFGTMLKESAFVKTDTFVSKEMAASKHKDIIGEDFMQFLGFNPLQNSYDINLKADFVQADSIKTIEQKFKENKFISDIVYDKHLVDLVNDNVKKITFWILVITGFLALIAVLLINSSMRLSIYSNRFIIKTMQMVGATKSFIRKPFIMRSIKLGVVGALLAIVAIIGVLFYIDANFPKLGILDDQLMIGAVLLSVLVLGVLISWFSTFFATQKFLNLRTDDLY
ncbi:MAG TPA: permease-like cell division protein FtsX [Flavobacterium sp.]|jgi:cell division transport system permease protein|nr:permease-like cell division protein FtsX [Flavobacterium sp.]HRZ31263.1 permease-like cell division protein FtsX [Flavobacterium sp.]HRZ74525.1 permease-like cell division protein FtsX [Flavobacterium sp.]